MNHPNEDLIRVVIVDDHTRIRDVLRKFVERVSDMVVVGEGATGIEALELVCMLDPDILLLDVELPELRGDEVAKRLQDLESEVPVLAVSSHDRPYWIDKMLSCGAAGYVTKAEVPPLLLVAIRYLAAGKPRPWLSPESKLILDKYYSSK